MSRASGQSKRRVVELRSEKFLKRYKLFAGHHRLWPNRKRKPHKNIFHSRLLLQPKNKIFCHIELSKNYGLFHQFVRYSIQGMTTTASHARHSQASSNFVSQQTNAKAGHEETKRPAITSCTISRSTALYRHTLKASGGGGNGVEQGAKSIKSNISSRFFPDQSTVPIEGRECDTSQTKRSPSSAREQRSCVLRPA